MAVYHLIGIGGSGMSGLARLLAEAGHRVQGSDRRASSRLESLRRMGVRVYVGHAAEHLTGAERVVVSTAIAADNPELQAARRRGLPVEHRAQVLAQVLEGRSLIAVSGTHGKTTTTAMTALVLAEAGLDPGYAVGAEVPQLGGSARLGRGPVVAEVDESDRSFLLFHPDVAVVTNVEPDHLEHYGSFEAIVDAFRSFVGQVRPGGSAVLCADDATAASLAGEAPAAATYGLAPGAGLRAEDVTFENGGGRFTVVDRAAGRLGVVTLRVPGRHNIANALAAVAVARLLDLPFERVASALAVYRGAERRFQLVAEVGGVRVIDDYAHHPTEVAATLAAARTHPGRLVVVFQPHRYTRTQRLEAAFAGAFADADLLFLTEIYAADEDPIPGVTGARLARTVGAVRKGPLVFEPDPGRLVERVVEALRPGDLLLTVGAGDVDAIGRAVVRRLSEGRAPDPVPAPRAQDDGSGREVPGP
ncbi:UDP-N-acetylmuramate--L-alanine ligase [Limnochorda pilosa]|uniref:UDP-N-acetylmuramate--L-alanine ligase n=1 Tax=Limnochorda pilosa TaxID=1555112 RepID=A0A0K2SKS3_LIMPI|nr:UDP-N-acetylmuramate--L-alanine ligase [Limnochorda pilosa]BAS27706.1 UDP-N-acetylmuramate--alanine ligase [Limnochorda pilosa]